MQPRYDADQIAAQVGNFFDQIAADGPGATIHHLLLLNHAPGPACTPHLAGTVGILAMVDDDVPTEEWIGVSVLGLARKATAEEVPLYLAALVLEMHAACVPADDEVAENRLRRAAADQQLGAAEGAVEMTAMYGVDVEGRRYGRARWHTGPRAGTTSDLEVSGPGVPPGSGADRSHLADGGRGDSWPFYPLLHRLFDGAAL